MPPGHQPLVEVTRGEQVESLHFGSIAVCDSEGNLIAGWGDPHLVTFTRSTAKPVQAYPLVAEGGPDRFGLTEAELAIACASHSGTDLHADTVARILQKIGQSEGDLHCGTHPPFDPDVAQRIVSGELAPSPLRHNCSGKHAGMLGLATLLDQPVGSYLDLHGECQQRILESVGRMMGLERESIRIGIDGCSAPNFAVPLSAGARAYARLAQAGTVREADPTAHQIYQAMTSFPLMVSGPGRFDTVLMSAGKGRILGKGGAEGCYALGLKGDPKGGQVSLGVMLKVSDGDRTGRAVRVAVLEVLRQLGRMSPAELSALEDSHVSPISNHRGRIVGGIRPVFALDRMTSHWPP